MTRLLSRRTAIATALATPLLATSLLTMLAGRAEARGDTAARIVVPFAAGGTTDLLGRVVAEILSERMGGPFTIENRTGAAGNISAEIVARAAPDGRTLLLGTVGTAVTNQYLHKHLPYDSIESFAPVALVAEMANVLVVHPDFPATTLKAFVEHCQAGPCKQTGAGQVSYGSSGLGSSGHLAMEYLQGQAGIKLDHVVHPGRARMIKELLAGQITVGMDNLPVYLKPIRSGALRALAVSSANRWFAAPEIPTVAEQGFGDFDATLWWYVAVPAGTRRDLVKKLSGEILQGMKQPAVLQKIRSAGAQERPANSDELFLHIAAENSKWKRVIAAAGLAPQ